MPNGAIRSPDVAWVSRARLNALAPEKRKKFFQIAPDFVIELRSGSDALTDLQAKMVEYMDNGVQLGWLIDTRRKRVYVYRPGTAVETLDQPTSVSGEPLLRGFTLQLADIWD